MVWTREYGGKDAGQTAEALACRRLSNALEQTGASRLVVGHTPQSNAGPCYSCAQETSQLGDAY